MHFCDDSKALLRQHCFAFSIFFNDGRYNTRKEHVIEELKKDANNFQKEVFLHFDFHHPCLRSPGGRRLRYGQVCQVPDLLVGPHREASHILCSQGFASFSTRSRYKMLRTLCLFCHPQLFLMLSLTGDFFDFDSLCRCLHDRDDPQHNAPDPTQGFLQLDDFCFKSV